MPKGFSEKERERIKQDLLHIGEEHFGRFGIRKSNIEEICRAAGIAKGSFYAFFSSKEELFMQVMEEKEHLLRTEIMQHLEKSDQDPTVLIRTLLQKLMKVFETDPLVGKIYNPETIRHLLRKLPPERIRRHQSADTEYHKQVLQSWEKLGLRLRITPETFAAVIKAFSFIALHREMDGFDYTAAIDFLIDATARTAVCNSNGHHPEPGEKIGGDHGTQSGRQRGGNGK